MSDIQDDAASSGADSNYTPNSEKLSSIRKKRVSKI